MKNSRGLWLLVVGLFFLSACRGESTHRLWMKAPGWSRAQAVGGMTIPDPAPFALDDEGNSYFLFINGDLEALQAQVLGLSAQGEPLWSHTFDNILRLPDEPRLVWDGQILHAFWISNGALETAQLDSRGNVIQEPAVISGDIRVDSYSAVGSKAGDMAVWFAGSLREPGLYMVDVTQTQEPRLIDEAGLLPSLRFNEAGTLQAIWIHTTRDNPQTEFVYAAYDNINSISGGGSVVFETSVPITADLIGPTLGLDADDVYIFWYVIYRTGLEAGFTETRFVTFPSSSPDQISSPERTFIPAEHDLDYEPFPEEAIKVGERYGLENQSFSRVGALQDIQTNLTPEDELAVAFRASIDYYWRRSSNQIAVLYFRDGLPTSYQLLSFTQQPSTDPTVISDANGNLYVSWLERGDAYRFDVFFASTSENLRNAFNPVTTNDIVDLSAATIFGLLTGVLLAPIAAVLFLILPMIVVGLTTVIRRGEQTFRSPGTVISFILAIAVFQVAKFAALPGMVDYVPFSAWIPLPDILKAPLQIMVPSIIMIGAVYNAWHLTYRRKTDSPLYFMILYVAVDTLFTMAIYGVLFYGAF